MGGGVGGGRREGVVVWALGPPLKFWKKKIHLYKDLNPCLKFKVKVNFH